jgi:hypothetical protein
MPSPPESGLFTQYVLENPWPGGVLLVLIGLGLLWSGLREGLGARVKWGGGLALAGVSLLLVGLLVVTPGERAKAVTRQLIDDVVANHSGQVAAASLFADSAAMSFTSPNNPGFDVQFIMERLDRLAMRYSIDSNTITMLRGYTESSDSGVVHLGCATSVAQQPGYAVTQWVLRVQKQPDGAWKITRLTWVSLNGQKPQPDSF